MGKDGVVGHQNECYLPDYTDDKVDSKESNGAGVECDSAVGKSTKVYLSPSFPP